MLISKKLNKLAEPLDIDYQLMASELDTSIKNMSFISSEMIQDAILSEAFNTFIKEIENSPEGVEIESFDDNTILYEYMNEAIVIYTNLGNKTILFDSILAVKIENKIASYKK